MSAAVAWSVCRSGLDSLVRVAEGRSARLVRPRLSEPVIGVNIAQSGLAIVPLQSRPTRTFVLATDLLGKGILDLASFLRVMAELTRSSPHLIGGYEVHGVECRSR